MTHHDPDPKQPPTTTEETEAHDRRFAPVEEPETEAHDRRFAPVEEPETEAHSSSSEGATEDPEQSKI